MQPPRIDVLVAGALFLAAVPVSLAAGGGSRTTASILTTAVLTIPLAFRRVAPLVVLATVVGGVLLLIALEVDSGVVPVPCVALAAFTAGRELGPPQAQIGAAVATAWLPLAFVVNRGDSRGEDVVIGTLAFGGAWWLGRTLRDRALQLAEARSAQGRRSREAGEQARADERALIARELHDVVSHSVSVIAVQAQGVRRRLHADQVVEAERLRDIETAAREAMVELRRLLGTLRHGGGPAPLAPQPGLAQLSRLAERTADAGLPVELEIAGTPRALPAGVDLTAYRIVQEALTNALRHAGTATARVRVGYLPDELRLEIEDTGCGAADAPPGRGLIGMRERVALLGGDLEVADADGGGFRVAARIPMRAGSLA